MFVGLCKFGVELAGASSLKDKRHFIQRAKQKSLDRFKVFLSEVEALDQPEKAVLGLALAGSDEHFLRSVIHKLLAFLEESEGVRISEEAIEVFQW